jgi:CheY-like chemotaxis protein
MKSILIVEDNSDVRELLGFLLRKEGFEVHEAENGRDALDQLEIMRPPPCLMLLDLMMPIMSGPELLQILSDRNRLADLPVVVLSAGGQPSQVPIAKRFIRKPADPKLLVQIVREVCGTCSDA